MSKKKYTITLHTNGKVFKKNTDDIESGILALQPDSFFTESFVSVTNGKVKMDRHLNLVQTKKLFNDEIFRAVFISNLLLA